ncbi:hypothetical protein Dsin_000681 [Dipteronia sinensis]|uniref:Uncharacterized protein n=1 Tax=Dipteronia sinensis TaxID=43782 RepID=A0AAE0B3X1_9ROSI|nr:hypothetical protein Dsin_000681 [Dipteronia sinensis]
MSFVMPAKYGADLPLPKDPSVRIKEVPGKVVAAVAISESGFVTDEEVKRRELKLRNALKDDKQFQVKRCASVEVAQVFNYAKLVAIRLTLISRLHITVQKQLQNA